jgi:hypothetical protein
MGQRVSARSKWDSFFVSQHVINVAIPADLSFVGGPGMYAAKSQVYGTIFSKFSIPLSLRQITIAIALSVFALLGASQAAAQTTSPLPLVQAYQSDAFVDSIGVVTHLTYTDTAYYYNWPTVYYDLQRLGVRHIRDGYYNWGSKTPFFSEHRQLASAGIKTIYVMPYSTSITPTAVQSIAQQVGDMEAIEAPNECDVTGYCGASQVQGMANMLSMLPTVVSSGKAANVPVIGPSFAFYKTYSQVGDLSSKMNYNNLHVYFGGRNPGSRGWGGLDAQGHAYGSIPFWLDMGNQDAPGVPAMITETGYMMFPQAKQYTIPPATGASYIPRTLLLAYMQGIKRTYLYELLEEPGAPGYGLIDGNMNPKPAYYAVQSLIGPLWDKGPSFTPGQLAYSVTGGDSTLKQILFQKRDGSFWLVMWLEQSSYDVVNLNEIPVTPQNVTLQVDGNYWVTNIGTIDDSGHMNWISTNPAGSTKTISVSDSVMIVKIPKRPI